LDDGTSLTVSTAERIFLVDHATPGDEVTEVVDEPEFRAAQVVAAATTEQLSDAAACAPGYPPCRLGGRVMQRRKSVLGNTFTPLAALAALWLTFGNAASSSARAVTSDAYIFIDSFESSDCSQPLTCSSPQDGKSCIAGQLIANSILT
jgi:hypothetical protein